jgi:hypothetical protein
MPLPEPEAVDDVVDEDEELLELPHALTAVAATTSKTRNNGR